MLHLPLILRKPGKPCRNAVEVDLRETFPQLSPHERDWIIDYIMERVIAGAFDILIVNRIAPKSADR